MTAAILTQFLVDVTRGHLKDPFMADREPVVWASMLDDATKGSVLACDIGALWLADAHPMALMYFARQCGWDNDRYYGCIERAEATKSAPAAISPPAVFEQPRKR